MTFQEHYQQKVLPEMMKQFGYLNPMAVPRIMKVSLNVGIGRDKSDEKHVNTVADTLTRITGQKPVWTKAKKSIAAFKIREGQTVGAKVTLRGKRMEDFLYKLIFIALPRIHDFRGLPASAVDQSGNLTIGFREHLAFPEIRPDEVERIHGLEVSIHCTARTRDEGFAFFKLLGFPFQQEK